MIRRMACTASRGYAPAAVSADSITASVPSMIAFATSLASARVGRGFSIIDSSICVAVMTGRPMMIRELDDLLLRNRHFLERELDAEVAARHHHAVGRAHDALDVLQRRVLLDLRDDEDRLGHQRAQLGDVGRAAHEAQREVVELLLDGERGVGAILLRDGRRGHVHAGKVDALVALDLATVHDARGDPRRIYVQHDELDEAIVHEYAITDVDVGRQRLVGNRHLVGPRLILRTEHDIRTLLEESRRGQRTDANSRPLQVAENGHRPAVLRRELAHDADGAGVLLVRAVREVDTGDVQARVHEAVDRLAAGRRGTERAHDLRARLIVRGHGHVRHAMGEFGGPGSTDAPATVADRTGRSATRGA